MIKTAKIGVLKTPRKLKRGVNSTINIVVPRYIIEVRNWQQYLIAQPSEPFLKDLELLIKQSKSINMFYECDRIGILATEQQQHARVSIVNPESPQLTEVNSPTWVANYGYSGDGSTKYINTNLNLLNGTKRLTQNDASFGCYILTNVQETGADMGTYTATSNYTILHSRFPANTTFPLINEGPGVPSFVTTDSRGLYAVTRTSTSRIDYKNGVVAKSATTASVAMPDSNMALLGRLFNTTLEFPSTKPLAMYWVGSNRFNQDLWYRIFQEFAVRRGFAV